MQHSLQTSRSTIQLAAKRSNRSSSGERASEHPMQWRDKSIASRLAFYLFIRSLYTHARVSRAALARAAWIRDGCGDFLISCIRPSDASSAGALSLQTKRYDTRIGDRTERPTRYIIAPRERDQSRDHVIQWRRNPPLPFSFAFVGRVGSACHVTCVAKLLISFASPEPGSPRKIHWIRLIREESCTRTRVRMKIESSTKRVFRTIAIRHSLVNENVVKHSKAHLSHIRWRIIHVLFHSALISSRGDFIFFLSAFHFLEREGERERERGRIPRFFYLISS